MRNYYLIITLLAAVLAGITFLLNRNQVFDSELWPIAALFFFYALTLLTSSLVLTAMKRKPKTFIYSIGGSTAIRFFFSIFFIVIYLIISDKTDVRFVVYFMGVYLFFTMFEISHLVIKLRAEKNGSIDATNV